MAASFAPPYHFIPSFVLGGSGHVNGMAREGTEGLCADSLLFHHQVLGSLYLAKMNFFTLFLPPSLALPTSPPPTPLISTYRSVTRDGRSCHQNLLAIKQKGYIYQCSRATYMTVSRQNEQEKSKIR